MESKKDPEKGKKKKEKREKPKYNMWQNTGFMLRAAFNSCKSVPFMCLALALTASGKAVLELLVRTYLCQHGTGTNTGLHRATVQLVNAAAQSAAMDRLLPLLTEDEQALYRRGRNAHTHAAPRGVSPGQYARATGMEALFGGLYLLGRRQRINELFARMMEDDHAL